jgi:hypothetical protein
MILLIWLERRHGLVMAPRETLPTSGDLKSRGDVNHVHECLDVIPGDVRRWSVSLTKLRMAVANPIADSPLTAATHGPETATNGSPLRKVQIATWFPSHKSKAGGCFLARIVDRVEHNAPFPPLLLGREYCRISTDGKQLSSINPESFTVSTRWLMTHSRSSRGLVWVLKRRPRVKAALLLDRRRMADLGDRSSAHPREPTNVLDLRSGDEGTNDLDGSELP